MISPEAVERWQWWDSLRNALPESCDSQAWANIWIGVMLRRYAEEHPDGLTRFRTVNAWAKLIEWQKSPIDGDLPLHFIFKLDPFLRAGGNCMGSANPWWISTRRVRVEVTGEHGYGLSEYVIERVRTLDQDVAFARANRLKEQTWRRESFMKQHGFDLACEDISDLDF